MKNKRIFSAAIILLLLIMLSVGMTIAWFINFGTNKVEGTEVIVSAGNVMEVSIDGTHYSSTIKKTDFGEKQMNLPDITGDGKSFLRPVLKSEQVAMDKKPLEESTYITSIAEPVVDADWIVPKSTLTCDQNGENYREAGYISMKIWFRGNVPMDVYLGSGSSVAPANPNGNWSVYAATDSNFSKDWIAAASRVSFVSLNDAGDPDKVLMIWDPQPQTELYYDTNPDHDSWGYKLRMDSTTTSYSYFTEVQLNGVRSYMPKELSNINNTKPSAGTPVFNKILATPGVVPEKEVPIATLQYDNDSGMYIGSAIVNLWIEGTDTEARRALAGGYIKFDLNFVGQEISNQ